VRCRGLSLVAKATSPSRRFATGPSLSPRDRGGEGLDSAPSASLRITLHTAATSARSVLSPPTETRTIQRPSTTAGVR